MSRWDGEFADFARREEQNLIRCKPHEKAAVITAALAFANRNRLEMFPDITASEGVKLQFYAKLSTWP
jgi:hypothetical protein